jgi:hypothetical protein
MRIILAVLMLTLAGGARVLAADSPAPARYDSTLIVNRDQFTNLPEPVMARLLRDGWVAVPGRQEQLFHVYEQNEYYLVPNFVTTDAMLQLMHLYFDFTLSDLEERKLFAMVDSLCTGLSARLREQKPLTPALERGILYAGMAEGLCATDSVWTPPAWATGKWAAPLAAQAKLILAADKIHKGPILGTVDYTMFRVRGHYTRSPALTRYFRVMMWLGLPGLVFDEDIVPFATPLILSHALARDARLQSLYDAIQAPVEFYVGPCDDITPGLVRAVADSICGANASLEAWLAHPDQIRDELIRRDPTRIKPEYADDRGLTQVRLMGQRYLPDAEMFQHLVDSSQRPFPSGLDLFAAIQVPAALEILHADPPTWSAYWPQLAELQARFVTLPPADAQDNLYWRWIHLLRTLNDPPPAAAPPFMTTPSWARKNLVTGLASWAELRHDTILYAKQSAAECGGGDLPPRVPGYVEPRPDVFDEIRNLISMTRGQLESWGLLDRRLRQVGQELEEKAVFLSGVARKELAGEPLDPRELEEIRIFGANAEYLTISLLVDDYARWFEISGPDRRLAVVADVHTAGGKVLEVGVGNADEIYVIVKDGENLVITRGAMFSYHEFTQPIANRLTDEQWHRMLDAGREPPRLPWIGDLVAPSPVPDLPQRRRYSSGC